MRNKIGIKEKFQDIAIWSVMIILAIWCSIVVGVCKLLGVTLDDWD